MYMQYNALHCTTHLSTSHSPDCSVFAGGKKAVVSGRKTDLGNLIGVTTEFSQDFVVVHTQVINGVLVRSRLTRSPLSSK